MKVLKYSLLTVVLALSSAFLFLVVITIAGYGGDSEYESISDKAPYKGFVGKGITSTDEFLLLGWSGSDHTIDVPIFYSVNSYPGTSNRFVKSRDEFQIGTRVKILDIVECTNCYLDFKPRIKFIVKIRGFIPRYNLPIMIDDSFLVLNWDENGQVITTSEYFESDT